MGRRRRRKVDKFYCPKCGRKTLSEEYDYDTGCKIWKCYNQTPQRFVDIIKYDEYYGRAQWDEDLQPAQKAKAVAYTAKYPPCDCVITTPGRDAEIVDFGCVLDLLVRVGEPIRYHLLESNSDIHSKGFEVLHQSDMLDIVRLRDKQGVGAYLYWKMSWEPDYDGIRWDQGTFTHTAASYISFRPAGGALADGHTLPSLFRRRRILLWTKDRDKNSYHMEDAIFDGSLTKKKRAAIVSWASELERQLPQLMEKATAAVGAWNEWGTQLKESVRTIGIDVHVNGFDAVHKRAKVAIHGWVSPDQARAIAAILTPKPAAT